MSRFAVKTFIGKVLYVTLNNMALDLSHDLYCSNIYNNVIMGPRVVVEYIDEHRVIRNEATGAKWFWKHLVTHGFII